MGRKPACLSTGTVLVGWRFPLEIPSRMKQGLQVSADPQLWHNTEKGGQSLPPGSLTVVLRLLEKGPLWVSPGALEVAAFHRLFHSPALPLGKA